MRRLYFSKSEFGFFASDVHGENIPSDCVEITPEEHNRLLDGQSSGTQRIAADANGYPILVEFTPPELPYDQKRRLEYPPMEDYLDGVVKGDQAQIDAYIAACLAVKAKYPKP